LEGDGNSVNATSNLIRQREIREEKYVSGLSLKCFSSAFDLAAWADGGGEEDFKLFAYLNSCFRQIDFHRQILSGEDAVREQNVN
jgi:hypothetical protein